MKSTSTHHMRTAAGSVLVAASMAIAMSACSKSDPNAAPEMPEKELIEQAKTQIRDSLRDPDSAKFRNMRWETKESLVLLCGEVNAKNAFGAYAGYEPFHAVQPGLIEKARYDPSAPLVIQMGDHEVCSG